MGSKMRRASFWCLALVSVFGARAAFAAEPGAQPPDAKPLAQNAKPDAAKPEPPRPGRRPVFGEVSAVRGNVLQIRTEEGEGLTRVILASDAMIIKDEKLKTGVLKPGAKVSGSGRPVEGTGTGSVPLKVEVQNLELAGGMGNPFEFFGFGGGGGPLMRGRRSSVFRKQNYSGTIEFSAQVQSVNPLVLVDEQGSPLPVIVGDDVEVHQRAPRPIKEGDITAGARLAAMGETTPDGLLNAHLIILFGGGSERGSIPGTITALTDKGFTLRPRFEPRDITMELDPAAKFYFQENLDLDSIHVGDTLAFTGKVIAGDAKAPKTLVLRTIAPAEGDVPQIDEGGDGPFGGGRSITATVKGKIMSLEPLRVQAEDGHEVTIKVPGQLTYARYRPLERGGLKAGQKALIVGRQRGNGGIADVIVVNPSLVMGPGF
jgi:hypothetical protein